MVGLVLVSHSKKLAEAVRELVLQMTAPDFPIAVASGVGDNHDELGTDAVHIADVLQELPCPEGVLVLMDLGSAVLSAETALELFDSANCPIRLCPAPLVEGAVAAAVRAQAGGTLEEVAQEAELGLAAKQQQLGVESTAELLPAATQSLTGTPDETAELVLEVHNQHGLHARPAAALVQTASRFSSIVEIANLTPRTVALPPPAASPAFRCSMFAKVIALEWFAAARIAMLLFRPFGSRIRRFRRQSQGGVASNARDFDTAGRSSRFPWF